MFANAFFCFSTHNQEEPALVINRRGAVEEPTEREKKLLLEVGSLKRMLEERPPLALEEMPAFLSMQRQLEQMRRQDEEHGRRERAYRRQLDLMRRDKEELERHAAAFRQQLSAEKAAFEAEKAKLAADKAAFVEAARRANEYRMKIEKEHAEQRAEIARLQAQLQPQDGESEEEPEEPEESVAGEAEEANDDDEPENGPVVKRARKARHTWAQDEDQCKFPSQNSLYLQKIKSPLT